MEFAALKDAVSPLESIGTWKLYLRLYLCLRTDAVGRGEGGSLAGLSTGFKYIEINVLSKNKCIQIAG